MIGKARSYVLYALMALPTACLICQSEAANILGLSPYYIQSHYRVIRNVFLELISKGHNVTVISAFKEDNLNENYHHIQVDKILLMKASNKIDVEPNMFEILKQVPFIVKLFGDFAKFRKYSENLMESKSVKDFIDNDNTHYDLIIAEDFRFSPLFMLAHKYKAPLVTFTTFGGAHWVEHYMSNPLNLHYVPHEILPYAGHLTLWERLYNLACSMLDLLAKEFYYKSMNEAFSERYYAKLPHPLPKPTDIEKNISLVLFNTHFSMDAVRPYLPNIVEVAGIHITPPKKLPEDLQSVLDNAKDGVVYFSMGSILQGKHLPQDKIDIFLKVFGKLKQTILWKWELDILPNKTKNIVIRKWFPQSDLLAHPNIHVFITHGGLLSLQEAVYCGVPVIGLPRFGDQPSNIKKAKIRGYAESLDLDTLNFDDTMEIVEKVLNDPSYRTRAKEMSVRINDKPRTAMETAIFWIEYVIRHKGAYHLKTPCSHMPWYEYYLLDVIGVLIGGSITILTLAYLLCRFLICALFSKRKHKPYGKKQR